MDIDEFERYLAEPTPDAPEVLVSADDIGPTDRTRNWRAARKTVGQWNDPQPLVAVETVRKLVDESLAWLRATTGQQFAA